MGCTLLIGIVISVVEIGFGKGGDITLDVQQRYGAVLFEFDLIAVQHHHPEFPYAARSNFMASLTSWPPLVV